MRKSARDEFEDFLGEDDDNAARDGQDAVGALGGVVRLEGQADLQNAVAEQNQADGADEREDEVGQVVDGGKRVAAIPACQRGNDGQRQRERGDGSRRCRDGFRFW